MKSSLLLTNTGHPGRFILLLGLVFLFLTEGGAQRTEEQPTIGIRIEYIQDKFSPLLRHELSRAQGDEIFNVEFLASNERNTEKLFSGLGLKPVFQSSTFSPYRYGICQANKEQLLSLVSCDCIQHLEIIRTPVTELKQEGLDLSLNEINLLRHERPDLAGSGMALSIKENNFDTTDIDFRGRYYLSGLTSPITQIHATNMTSIAGGGGNSYPTAKGVAWDATLTTSNFEILLPDPEAYFDDYNITVQNHSYGTGIENYYGIESEAYDQLCTQQPTLIHVFSSGNSGDQAPSDGTFTGLTGWANLTGQFKQSKNTITIGATDSLGNVVSLSSRGPAYDGRIKPEITAYGHGGTSGAAALVSGLSLLLQEAYKKGHEGKLPPSSLVKAILVNTASDTDIPGPDYKNGFGSVRGNEAVQSISENHWVVGQVVQGDSVIIPVSVPVETAQIKITMAWNDQAGEINAPRALVNDLDLELKSITTNELWLPWILNSIPHPDSLALPAKRGVDTINNIEQITILSPGPGDYEIRVKGNTVKSESQEFSMTWSFDAQHSFHWVYPTGTDHLVPGMRNILRWNATGDTPGRIEYRSIENKNWLLLQDGVFPADLGTRWISPEETGLFQLRWIWSDTTILSDTFIVADELSPSVGFLCADSLLLHWMPDYADGFEVWRIGERHLKPFDFTSDTNFITHDIDPAQRHYAVAGLYRGLRGPLSYGLDVTTQGAGCYLNTFFLRYVDDGIAFFEANLGSLYNVHSVRLEKWSLNTYEPVEIISPVTEMKVFPQSKELSQGINYFRLTVLLLGGTSITSEVVTVYYTNQNDVLVFPNPTTASHGIHVLVNSNKEFELMIVDYLGRKILSFPEPENPQQIPTSGLIPGYYVVVIRYEDGDMDVKGFAVKE